MALTSHHAAPRARLGLRLALVCGALTLVGAALAAPAAADRAFTPRFALNAKGDIVHTGNTLMTCPLAAATCASARIRSSGSHSWSLYRLRIRPVDCKSTHG